MISTYSYQSTMRLRFALRAERNRASQTLRENETFSSHYLVRAVFTNNTPMRIKKMLPIPKPTQIQTLDG